MAQLLIRNLDAAVLNALRHRAAACGTSTEEQARRALTQAVGLDREEAVRRLDQVRAEIGRLGDPSSLDELRHDRRRDET